MPLVASVSAFAQVDGSPLVVAKPSGVAFEDLLVILVANNSTTGDPEWDNSTNKPAGFTLRYEAGNGTSDCHIAMFTRVVNGSEASTFSVPSVSGGWNGGWCLRVTGAPRTAIYDGNGTPVINGSATDRDIPAYTTTVDDCLAIGLLAFDGADGDPFTWTGTGWTENDSGATGGGSGGVSATFATKPMPTAGTTGSPNVAFSSIDGSVGLIAAIRSSAGAWFTQDPAGFTTDAVDFTKVRQTDDAPWN